MLSASDHMYKDGMKAAAACSLGDLELRESRADTALIQYRKAWQTIQESPTMNAHERHGARALAGMAAAYAASGDLERAISLLRQGEERLKICRDIRNAAAGANLAELEYCFAVACVRIGNGEEALRHLHRAVAAGWCDSNWLQEDPELSPLRSQPQFSSLVEQTRISAQTICN